MKQESGQEIQKFVIKTPIPLVDLLPSAFCIPRRRMYVFIRPSVLPSALLSGQKKEVPVIKQMTNRNWNRRWGHDDKEIKEMTNYWLNGVLQVIILLLAFALAAETCRENNNNNNNRTIGTVCSCWQNENSSEITVEEDEQESDECLHLIFQILPEWLGLKRNGRLALTCISTYRVSSDHSTFSSTPLSK